MIHWQCDLCGYDSDERMVRGLIWPEGLHILPRELTPDQRERYKRTRSLSVTPPTLRFDICFPCVAKLAAHMFEKGQQRSNGRGVRRCCVCQLGSRAAVRLYYGSISWPNYQFTGNFCTTHVKPLIAVSREDGAKGGDRLLRQQGIGEARSGRRAEIHLAGLT